MPEAGSFMMIALAAHSFADAEPALGFASLLARKLGLPLKAFLLAQEAAMLASAFPMAKATLPDGNRTEVTFEAMEEAYRTDLRALQAALVRMDGGDGFDWSAENISSDLNTFAASSLGRNTLVIVGFQRLIKSPDEIILLSEGETSNLALYKLANLVSGKASLPVTALSAGSKADHAGILRQLTLRSPALVLVSRPLAEKIGVDDLVSTSRCPVMICPETPDQT